MYVEFRLVTLSMLAMCYIKVIFRLTLCGNVDCISCRQCYRVIGLNAHWNPELHSVCQWHLV